MEENIFVPVELSADNSLEIAKKAIEILNIKDAKNIKLLHVEKQTVLTDYFVLCTGNSNTQIKSYSGELEFRLGECGLTPLSIEGFNEASWIVMDYGPVIIHIFNRETRNFYNLEKLWEEGTEIDISDLVTEK